MIGLGLIPVPRLFISLVFKSVAESACRFVLGQSGHPECSELRLTDSGERGIKHIRFSHEKDKAEEYICEGRGIMRGKGSKQQFRQCRLTSNCWKHLT